VQSMPPAVMVPGQLCFAAMGLLPVGRYSPRYPKRRGPASQVRHLGQLGGLGESRTGATGFRR
jgi:hypothetical protein